MSEKRCPNCGTPLPESARYCHNCSTDLTAVIPQPDDLASQPTQSLTEASPAASSGPVDPGSAGPEAVQPNAPDSTDLQTTKSLAGASTAFAPLPEGALLPFNEPPRYSISETRSIGSRLNVYLVETLQPVRLCLNSECPRHEVDDIYCPECGAQTSEPAVLHYLLKESSEANTFASLAYIRQAGLKHNGLLLYDQFQDTPYGTSPRHYLLEPELSPTLMDSLTPPQELARVLDWGQQLAAALAYLHSNGLVWRMLTGHHVAIENKRARWVNFNTVGAQIPADYQRDVQALAMLLFYLATGLQSYSSNHQLPEPVGALFEQILGRNPSITTATDLTTTLQTTLAEVRQPTSVRLISAGQTDVGSVRDHNEDSLMTQALDWSNKGVSRPVGLYVVADGMGGHSAGEVASGLVIDALTRKMASEIMATQVGSAPADAFDPAIWLQEAIAAANTVVFEQAKQTRNDMGTTVVAALMIGDTAYIGHVGDSRAYLLTPEKIRQLTVDHSLVERLVATGQITREEAQDHPQRNVIYRTVGDKSRVEVDVATHHLMPGECLLLCSDGLSGMISDDDIWRIVQNSPSLPDACQRLINAANAAGGDDNITAILVRVEAS